MPMARIVLTRELSRQFTGGQTEFELEAGNVRRLIKALEAKFPGLGAQLEARMAVAIDGEIYQDPYLETIDAGSEVYFLPKIGGG